MKKGLIQSVSAIALALFLGGLATSCDEKEETVYVLQKEDITVVEPAGGFTAEEDQLLKIEVKSVSDKNVNYQWILDDEVISQTKNLSYMCEKGGNFDLVLRATQNGVSFEYSFLLKVKFAPLEEDTNGKSPYITKVLDYLPAPGQFVNGMPEYVAGDTQESMNAKVLAAIEKNKKGTITLGSYGGYVVVGFDHTIVNMPGEKDFMVLGNAFEGSSEPGIVMVAYDANKNGKPDADEWYELAGSEYKKAGTIKGYEITYSRNEVGHQPTPDEDHYIADLKNCPWTDNQSNSGYVCKNTFNTGDYYPQWITANQMKFAGTLLTKNGVNTGSDQEEYWVLSAYEWGYADNTSGGDSFDIGWAVDTKGNSIDLPGVDFIKIYTGVNQYCGWLGETSTEVSGVTDLHLLNK